MNLAKYTILFLALACGFRSSNAENPAGNSPAIRAFPDIPYVTNGTDRQKLDIYLPPDANLTRPLVIWIHGGGWQSGDRKGCPAKPLVFRGYAVASIGYRLSEQAIFPAQIEDCKGAIRWLRAHAAQYKIDQKRFGVWGDSAGGHLVALLGTTGGIHDFDVGENLDQSSNVQCAVDWYGPTDFLHWGDSPISKEDNANSAVSKLFGGPVSDHADLARRASPLYFVTANSAPFLIMHGEQDRLVPVQQSKEFNDALQKASVESTLKILPGAGHGDRSFWYSENIKIVADFFDRHLFPGKGG